MSIQYAGGTIAYDLLTTGTGSPANDYLLQFIASLTTAGWSVTDNPAQVIGTFTGQPSNNDTITLDSAPSNKTYRFRTSGAGLAAINDVLIDVDAATTYANLVLAITAGAGAGTKYFTGTTAHVTMTATSNATTITVAYRTAGSAGNGAPVSESAANFTWAASTLSSGYTWMKSAATPQGLQCGVKLYTSAGAFYTPGTTLHAFMTSFDLARVSTVDIVNGTPTASTQYRFLANKYQFFIYQVGATPADPGAFAAGGIPFLQSPLVAPLISAATNATPIVCTVASHGFVTGQQVFNTGGIGNTAINGLWTITVVNANSFSLNTSVGNGTYTANSARCANTTIGATLSEVIWGQGLDNAGLATWRQNIRAVNYYTSLNGSQINAGGAPDLQLVKPIIFQNGSQGTVQWYNNNYLMFEPIMAGGVSVGATAKIIGQVWDAVIVILDLTLEQTATFDTPAHNFIALGVDGTNVASLLVATS